MGIEITKKAWRKISKTVKDTKKQWDYLMALNERVTKLEGSRLEHLHGIKIREPKPGDYLSNTIIENEECDCQDYEAGLVSMYWVRHNENPIERDVDFTEPDNNGLKQDYILRKADGSEVDPDGFYFVLKIGGKLENPTDYNHHQASRKALGIYAESISGTLPKLSHDLIQKLNEDWSGR